MIDTHCHLDLERFDADRAEVIARAEAAGVRGVLVPGIRPATWRALVELGRSHVMLRVALGVHPQIVPELAEAEVGDLAAQIIEATREAGALAVAVGECGLDGGTGEHARQEELFRAHVRAARELKLPLVVHVLRAHDVAPRILREEKASDVGGVMHSYSGGAALVPIYRDLGMAFAFAGPVTYPNARRPLEAARVVPGELLLAETDAPDQAPAAHQGSRSEPAYVAEVIGGLAAARQTSPEEMARLTTENARRIFRWPP
ncbi:MAG TPA: TatD family hydrolase [Kofleriaceae bacterium]|nr:TatD family hydrolase [Kofleriaceae bacterium]